MTIKYTPRKNPSPRRLALRANQKFYNTGKACKHGHTCDRITKNGQCIECYEIGKKVNYAKYKQNHPDHAEMNKKRQQEYRAANPEAYRIYIREYMRDYRKTAYGKERTKAALAKYKDSIKGQEDYHNRLQQRKEERIETKREMWRQTELDLGDSNGNT